VKRLIKLAPPPLKIRPKTPLKPLAAKLLALGMARTMAGR
jgi:hypothetical protein